jgi:hypothetical protein
VPSDGDLRSWGTVGVVAVSLAALMADSGTCKSGSGTGVRVEEQPANKIKQTKRHNFRNLATFARLQ